MKKLSLVHTKDCKERAERLSAAAVQVAGEFAAGFK